MTQSIIYSNYKFDITVGQSSVDIQVFDTTSTDKYAGTVNEHEIYVNPIDKFAKLLIGALGGKKDFSIGLVRLPDKLKCQLTYKTDFIELEETFALDKQACTPEQFEISILQMEKLKLEQVNQQFQAKVSELNARVQELEAEIATHSSVDIQVKTQMLQEMEVNTMKRIKKLEAELRIKEEETEKKLLEKTTQVNNELSLQEKRLTMRICDFEQREQNNLLPKVAEKSQIPILNCTQDIFDKMLKNDKEYVVHFQNDYMCITNYGKVFCKQHLSPGQWNNFGSIRYNYMSFFDFEISVMNPKILKVITQLFIHDPTSCGSVNCLYLPIEKILGHPISR